MDWIFVIAAILDSFVTTIIFTLLLIHFGNHFRVVCYYPFLTHAGKATGILPRLGLIYQIFGFISCVLITLTTLANYNNPQYFKVSLKNEKIVSGGLLWHFEETNEDATDYYLNEYIYYIYGMYYINMMFEYIIVSYRYRQCTQGTQIERPSILRRISNINSTRLLSRTVSMMSLSLQNDQNNNSNERRNTVTNSEIAIEMASNSDNGHKNNNDHNSDNRRNNKVISQINGCIECGNSKSGRMLKQYVLIIIIYLLLFGLLLFSSIWMSLTIVCFIHVSLIVYFNFQFMSLLDWFMNQFTRYNGQNNGNGPNNMNVNNNVNNNNNNNSNHFNRSNSNLRRSHSVTNGMSRDMEIIKKVVKYTKIMCFFTIIGFILMILFDNILWILPIFIFLSNVFESKCFIYNNHWLLSPIEYCKNGDTKQHPCFAFITLLICRDSNRNTSMSAMSLRTTSGVSATDDNNSKNSNNSNDDINEMNDGAMRIRGASASTDTVDSENRKGLPIISKIITKKPNNQINENMNIIMETTQDNINNNDKNNNHLSSKVQMTSNFLMKPKKLLSKTTGKMEERKLPMSLLFQTVLSHSPDCEMDNKDEWQSRFETNDNESDDVPSPLPRQHIQNSQIGINKQVDEMGNGKTKYGSLPNSPQTWNYDKRRSVSPFHTRMWKGKQRIENSLNNNFNHNNNNNNNKEFKHLLGEKNDRAESVPVSYECFQNQKVSFNYLDRKNSDTGTNDEFDNENENEMKSHSPNRIAYKNRILQARTPTADEIALQSGRQIKISSIQRSLTDDAGIVKFNLNNEKHSAKLKSQSLHSNDNNSMFNEKKQTNNDNNNDNNNNNRNHVYGTKSYGGHNIKPNLKYGATLTLPRGHTVAPTLTTQTSADSMSFISMNDGNFFNINNNKNKNNNNNNISGIFDMPQLNNANTFSAMTNTWTQNTEHALNKGNTTPSITQSSVNDNFDEKGHSTKMSELFITLTMDNEHEIENEHDNDTDNNESEFRHQSVELVAGNANLSTIESVDLYDNSIQTMGNFQTIGTNIVPPNYSNENEKGNEKENENENSMNDDGDGFIDVYNYDDNTRVNRHYNDTSNDNDNDNHGNNNNNHNNIIMFGDTTPQSVQLDSMMYNHSSPQSEQIHSMKHGKLVNNNNNNNNNRENKESEENNDNNVTNVVFTPHRTHSRHSYRSHRSHDTNNESSSEWQSILSNMGCNGIISDESTTNEYIHNVIAKRLSISYNSNNYTHKSMHGKLSNKSSKSKSKSKSNKNDKRFQMKQSPLPKFNLFHSHSNNIFSMNNNLNSQQLAKHQRSISTNVS